ncbi:MAG: HD domain-containing protein [Planctomycetota bacterium]|nr:HD domain-containing protein [Planctomycetota bacterium]
MINIIKFYSKVRELKSTMRRGWQYHSVGGDESVADHIFGVSLLTLVLSDLNDSSLDTCKCLRLALSHDLCECIIGDVIPHDNIPIETKHNMERNAMEELCSLLDSPSIIDLWHEFEFGNSAEAKLVRDIDIIETLFEAYSREIEFSISDNRLQEFWDAADENLSTDTGRQLLRIILDMRSNT